MITGSCLCGAVRWAVDGRLSEIRLCHCSRCRRASGGPFAASARCRARDFRWLSGEDSLAEHSLPSGYRRRFCRTCGSPAPSPTQEGKGMAIPPGTLDADPKSRVAYHVFVGSKAPWFEITGPLPQYPERAPVRETR